MFVIFACVNVRCGPLTTELSNEGKIAVLLLTAFPICQREDRLKSEPNDNFNQATCVDKSIGNLSGSCSFRSTTIFPASDKDFFQVSINSGSFRIYVRTDSLEPASSRVTYQLFDINQNLIFDPEDRKFDSVSSTLIENRFLTKEDCESQARCSDSITKFRLVRFDPKLKQIYIQFYALANEVFEEGRGNLHMLSGFNDSNVDPSGFGITLLQGDFKPCN